MYLIGGKTPNGNTERQGEGSYKMLTSPVQVLDWGKTVQKELTDCCRLMRVTVAPIGWEHELVIYVEMGWCDQNLKITCVKGGEIGKKYRS